MAFWIDMKGVGGEVGDIMRDTHRPMQAIFEGKKEEICFYSKGQDT